MQKGRGKRQPYLHGPINKHYKWAFSMWSSAHIVSGLVYKIDILIVALYFELKFSGHVLCTYVNFISI